MRSTIYAAALVALLVGACSGAQPPSTPGPTATAEVENAFLANVDDLIGEANDLAVTRCDELTVLTADNTNLVPSVRGFAATLKRVGGSQAVLNTESVKAALTDLDHSLSDMEAALSLCGISQR